MTNGDQDGNEWKKLTSASAAAVALTGVLVGLATTGFLDRMQRNHSTTTLIAFLLVVAGALVWVLHYRPTSPPGPTLAGRPSGAGFRNRLRLVRWVLSVVVWPMRRLLWFFRSSESLGVVLFSAGVLVGVYAVVQSHGDPHQPRLTATYDADKQLLTAQIHDDALTKNSRLRVFIAGLDRLSTGSYAFGTKEQLYDASVGPDADGNVDHPVTIGVPPGRYAAIGVLVWTGGTRPDCLDEGSQIEAGAARAGCTIIPLPTIPVRPQLSAAFLPGANAGRELHIHIAAQNLSDNLLVLAVAARIAGGRHVHLVREVFAPNQHGTVEESLDVAVPTDATQVCAKAKLVSSNHIKPPFVGCPILKFSLSSSTAELLVPV